MKLINFLCSRCLRFMWEVGYVRYTATNLILLYLKGMLPRPFHRCISGQIHCHYPYTWTVHKIRCMHFCVHKVQSWHVFSSTLDSLQYVDLTEDVIYNSVGACRQWTRHWTLRQLVWWSYPLADGYGRAEFLYSMYKCWKKLFLWRHVACSRDIILSKNPSESG